MIEESALPDGIIARGTDNALGKTLFQKTDPSPQLEVILPANEQMNVIGHDHVAAYRDVVLGIGRLCEFNERSRDWIGREDRSSTIGAGRHEEDRIAGNNAIQSWRCSGKTPHPVAAALWAAWEPA
jgi:hypothetical protein